MINLPGYSLKKRIDREDTTNGFGGGILIYVNTELLASELDDSLFNGFVQAAGIKIKTKGGGLNIITIYRPHRLYNGNHINENDLKLENVIKNAPKPCLIVGDFNYPDVCWRTLTGPPKCTPFLQSISDNFYTQHVNFATHISDHILDLVLSSNDNLVGDISNLGPIDKSDHTAIKIVTNSTKYTKKGHQRLIWKRADKNAISDCLKHWNWKQELSGDTNEKFMTMVEKINNTIDTYVPRTKLRTRDRPPWMNPSLLKAIRKKRRLWNVYNTFKNNAALENYRQANTKLRKDIRNAKKKYEESLTVNLNENNKKFYNYIRSKKSNSHGIGPLKIGNSTTDNDELMAVALNEFFLSVFTVENPNIPSIDDMKPNIETTTDLSITEAEIEKRLRKMKRFGAPGPDKIFTSFLQDYCNELKGPLCDIINSSYQTTNVPEMWRTAAVTPIFKKGSKFQVNNYRPISLTSIPCKIMETILKEQIVDHLTKHSLIKPTQFGFMKKKSCLLNLLTYLENLTSLVDSGEQVDVVYLDFSKAFDKVPHRRLKNVLIAHGINGKTLNWIMAWLKDRKQYVKINDSMSPTGEVISGVPQGSILGPILFIIYINTMDGAVEHLIDIVSKFADDSKIGNRATTAEQRDTMQTALDRLGEWSNTWQMVFNESKCTVMHLGKKNIEQTYSLNNVTLSKSVLEKDIGVMVSSNLKPSEQCTRAAQIANVVLGQMCRGVLYRDEKVWVKLYTTYVRPYLEYSTPAWNPWYEKDILTLEKVQERALKQVTTLGHLAYHEKLLHLGLMSLKDRRTRFDLCQVWKILNGHDDTDETTWFRRTEVNSLRQTRFTSTAQSLIEPRCNGDIRRNFFTVRVVKPWNNLPDPIKNSHTLKSFKIQYDHHYSMAHQ